MPALGSYFASARQESLQRHPMLAQKPSEAYSQPTSFADRYVINKSSSVELPLPIITVEGSTKPMTADSNR